jgi:hypothetical protein
MSELWNILKKIKLTYQSNEDNRETHNALFQEGTYIPQREVPCVWRGLRHEIAKRKKKMNSDSAIASDQPSPSPFNSKVERHSIAVGCPVREYR